jgi:hypothetical protein
MRRWLLVVPLVLAGCNTGGRFAINNRSCGEDYLNWSGGLTYSLLQGPGDGTFDYDPPGQMQTELKGSYNLQTGDFNWDVSYDPSHWRTDTTVTGYGYAMTNGDLDIGYTTDTTDVLGASYPADVRVQRTGCDMAVRTDYGGGDVYEEAGTYAGGKYQYEDDSTYNGAPWIVQGTQHDDHTYTETLDFSSAQMSYSYTENGDADGYSKRDFTQTQGTDTFAGYIEDFLDGTEHVHYTVDSTGTWDYQTDYSGNGSGTYSESGVSCNLTFTNGNCAYDCGSSGSGSC